MGDCFTHAKEPIDQFITHINHKNSKSQLLVSLQPKRINPKSKHVSGIIKVLGYDHNHS